MQNLRSFSAPKSVCMAMLVALLCLQGCSWLLSADRLPDSTTGFELRPPASLGRELTAYQSIQVDFERETFNLQCALSVSRHQLQLVLMDPLGQRLATLNYDGRNLQVERQRWLNTKFPPSYMLEAVQMIFWPLSSLQQMSPERTGWRFEQRENTRTAYYQGEPVAITEYLDPSPWTGNLQHTNSFSNYKLRITSRLLGRLDAIQPSGPINQRAPISGRELIPIKLPYVYQTAI